MEGVSVNGTRPMEVNNYILNVLNSINELNESSITEELKCSVIKLHRQEQPYEAGCEVDWDSLLCWPHTSPGSLAVLPCFDELNGIPYDKSREYIFMFRTYIFLLCRN